MESIQTEPFHNVETVLETYGNLLFRICFIMLGNEIDAEDAVQETLIKYVQKKPVFRDAEHEKAWLLTVAGNQCKDMLRFKKKHSWVELEKISEAVNIPSDSGILEALMTLPEKYKMVLMLYYVEGYPIEEIAKIIGRTKSAVKMRLQKGRKLLKVVYKKDYM